MQRFEYKILPSKVEEGHLDESLVEPILNRLASEGWEILAVTPIIYEGSTISVAHHLRRAASSSRSAGFPVGQRHSED